jgi:o-succinylbenzoate---CoA ligase
MLTPSDARSPSPRPARGGALTGITWSGRLVALRLPPGPQVAAALHHLWSRGDTPLPLPDHWPEPRVRGALAALKPAALIDGGGETRLSESEPVDEGVALVVVTSGSTGGPKAVELDASALDHAVRESVERLRCQPGDRWLCCLPLHHVAGVSVLLRAAALGTAAVVHPGFDADEVVAEEGVTHVSLVPTMLHRLLEAGGDLTRFERVLLGGSAISRDLLGRAARAGADVVESYGMTETCGGCVYDGLPFEGVEVDVVDDDRAPPGAGRVAVRGPVVMRGYRLRPDLTGEVLRDGLLLTNDIGRWEEGRLRVLGRRDDVIITGGINVVAGEVAALLRDHPAVADVAVRGSRDEEWGEVVVAVCVPRDPGHPPSLDDLRSFVRERAPGHLAPRRLLVVDELPRDGLGEARAPADRPAGG